MGTFRARLTLFSTSGDAFTTGGVGDEAYHSYVSTAAAKHGFINYHLIGSNIFLDGSITGVQFAGLPAGFTPVSPLRLSTPSVALGGTTIFASANVGNLAGGTAEAKVNYGIYGPKTVNASPALQNAYLTVNDIVNFTAIDLISLLTIELTADSNGGVTTSLAYAMDEIDVEGDYIIEQWSWTIGPDTVEAGTEVTVESIDTDILDLTEITEICFDFNGLVICSSDFITQTPNLLVFTIPSGINYSGTVIITGTRFSGSVALGALTYLLEDSSGIYTLVKNKANDTLYDGSRSAETNDVKIPNPRARTGYLGG